MYRLADSRRRCPRCAYTFHDFSRRYVNSCQLTCLQWLRLVKLFELEVPAAQVAAQLGMTYNTAYKALTVIRRAILAEALDASALLALSNASAPGLGGGRFGRSLVFGLTDLGGWAFADVVPNLFAESLVHFKVNFSLRTGRVGGVAYTDPYRHYDTLLCCPDPGLIPHFAIQDRGIRVDTGHRFWRYAKERFRRLKGVTPERFPLYVKEFEFRYNHRDQDLFPLLIARLCSFVPNLE